jgi:large subunit ribosomal protein L31
MKKDTHPTDYRPVIFQDLNNGVKVVTRSTVKTDDKIKLDDGKEYPLVKVHISSSSHPFFTGQEKLVDIEGRVDKFKARQLAADKARANKAAAAKNIKPAKPAKDEIEAKEPSQIIDSKDVEEVKPTEEKIEDSEETKSEE